jgi:hypothetical protein
MGECGEDAAFHKRDVTRCFEAVWSGGTGQSLSMGLVWNRCRFVTGYSKQVHLLELRRCGVLGSWGRGPGSLSRGP